VTGTANIAGGGALMRSPDRDEALTDVAEALLLEADPAAAQRALLRVDRDPDSRAWADWARLATLLMEERVGEACAIIALIPRSESISRWIPGYDDGWRRVGEGSITPAGDAARFVGLGGRAARLEQTAQPTNASGVLVEFVARRSSGRDGDCRLELSDGTVRESVHIDAGCVRLLNGSGSVPVDTHRPHHFALWVRGQRSRLFVDGQPALEANGLEADNTRAVRFGIFPAEGGADTESQWWRVSLLGAGTDGGIPLLPPPWPAVVWVRLAERAMAADRWPDALSIVVRGRMAHPADRGVEAMMLECFVKATSREELAPVASRAMNQLALADRSLVIAQTGGSSERLVLATDLGVSFARVARKGSVRVLARRLLTRAPRVAAERFWALRHISFELRAGEMLGIIGRNGAGKSTLLRLIADLIEPEEGRLEVSGKRILLSMGGSFLPDLTGRDNLYLAGLYLGMTRREIDAQIDEIVEFGELWDAIDRPFRTYSTGMMSRLQFALATTVSPELLMLDELLGAGDASFVEKAETRMNRLLRRAKAVILVTHNLEFVERTCTQAILLDHGEVVFRGSPARAVMLYRDLLSRQPKRSERVS